MIGGYDLFDATTMKTFNSNFENLISVSLLKLKSVLDFFQIQKKIVVAEEYSINN